MSTKVSALPAATTPLSASDILMVVQDGVSKQSPVSGLPSAGGLTNLTEAKNTAAPNATVPVVSLSVTITEADGDFALVPKGTGAIVAAIPNGVASGGNKRGNYAVDLQLSRGHQSYVASGSYAAIGGGADNRASGSYSVISGGAGNSATSGHAFVGGGDNHSNGSTAGVICGGYQNGCGPDGYASLGGGANNYATGQFVTITGGYYATTRGIYGAEAHASGRFAAQGDAQRERFILRKATTDATPTAIAADGGSAIATNQIVLPDSSAYAFNGYVVARSNATGDSAKFVIDGLIKRGAGAGTTALVGTPTVTKSFSDAGASAWTLAVTANTTLGCLSLTVTGVAATNIKWVADIETVEVVN